MRNASMESKGRQIQFGLIIVLFLSSLIVPVILLYPIQEMLYRPNEFYYFAPYFNAYIIFMVSLFVMALVLLINYLIIPKTKKKKEYSTWSSVCFLINCLRFYRIKL
ncbi:alkaline shock response membrane anchor protein AmaP [Lysinibacillus boronitolerans]|uniref:alkaline shock response membrane anchor protein AmaP n=1 Tax=Lysinibacillus boronitolerans TaxID=309788 RepID=UPI001EE66F87|nr:alkaline shock response membrane anchor protein AmaP [Lysinibacillus boronitolerans]